MIPAQQLETTSKATKNLGDHRHTLLNQTLPVVVDKTKPIPKNKQAAKHPKQKSPRVKGKKKCLPGNASMVCEDSTETSGCTEFTAPVDVVQPQLTKEVSKTP